MLSVFVVGCANKDQPVIPGMGEKTTTVGVGAQCGGPENIKCASLLVCEKEVKKESEYGVCVDTVVNNAIDCPTNQDPVCAQKGRNRNGYLNTCEAERHGAEIVHGGFCKSVTTCTQKAQSEGTSPNTINAYQYKNGKCEKVVLQQCNAEGCVIDIPFPTKDACEITCAPLKNLCEAKALSTGNCEAYAEGYEYVRGKCEKINLSGCTFDIPFSTQEACENSCR